MDLQRAGVLAAASRTREAALAPFFSALDRRGDVSADDRRALLAAVEDFRTVDAGTDIVSEGEAPTTSTLLVSGFAARYSVVCDGGRQITALHLPGDFVDLHSFPLRRMDHSVGAIEACTVAVLPHRRLERIVDRRPHLTRLLWMLTLIDSAIQRQWIIAKGRMNAAQHMAGLVCELHARAEIAGQLVGGNAFRLPLTQVQLGDTLGLSTVHVSRTLRALRARHLFTWRDGVVTVPDLERLQREAQFDPAYLHLHRDPGPR